MKYWAYVNNEIKGPFEPEELVKIDGFSPSTLICPQSPVEEETKEWKEAKDVPEISIMITGNLSCETEVKTEPQQLSAPQKSDEIIIERFGADTLFTPVHETDVGTSAQDPLTLSQIRKKSQEISDLSPETPQSSQDKDIEKNQEQIILDVSLKDSSENLSDTEKKQDSLQQMPVKDSLDIFEIPSTEEFLKESSSTVEEMKSEVKEFNTNPVEFHSSNDLAEPQSVNKADDKTSADTQQNITSKLEEIKEKITSELIARIDEKISSIEERFKNQPATFDLDKIKSDIISEIELKIKDAIQSIQPHQAEPDENLKKDFEEIKNLTAHFDIEIKDLRAKVDKLENISVQPASLSKENISQLSKQQTNTLNESSSVSVSIPSQDDGNKKIKLKKVLLVILLAAGSSVSVLFALKQFGIFDFTSLLSSRSSNITKTDSITSSTTDNQNLDTQNQSNFNSSITNQTYTSSFTASISTPTQPPQAYESNEATKAENIPVETIINEVKDYRIKSPYNLETTIKMVIKSRRADLSSLTWQAEAKEKESSRYIITVSAKGAKPIEFKFEFDYKTKILQPLNTISINTLKMMMGSEYKKNTNGKNTSSTKKSAAKKQKKNIKVKDQKKESENIQEPSQLSKSDEDTDNQQNNSEEQQSSNSNEEEFLIIGE